MKTKLFVFSLVLATLTLSSCQQKQIVKAIPEPNLVPAENFDSIIDDRQVGLYTIKNGGMTMQVTNFGGRVVSLFVPCGDTLLDVGLGHNTLDEYINYAHERFLGTCVGPVANIITGASYTYEGKTYKLSVNNGGTNMLHGGLKGLDSQVWDVKEKTDSTITFHFLHYDGLEGFPGNLDIDMTYSLTADGTWRIDYLATTDQTRPVNITNHPYFNLSGEGNGDCLDYILYINGENITDFNEENLVPITGTAMDYTTPHAVRDAVESDDAHMVARRNGFDHNYAINVKTDQDTTFVASLYNPANGLLLQVFSDQPGLQVYDGHYFKGTEIGKCGKTLDKYSSFTFETQHYPDSPNKPAYPNVFLKPGEEYHHVCIYRFSTQK